MRTKKNPVLILMGAIVLAGATAMAVQQAKRTKMRIDRSLTRWHPITINRDIEQVTQDSMEMKPLLALGDAVEIQISPAPDNKATVISGRINRDSVTGKDAHRILLQLRAALRNTQSLFETGEVLQADRPPSTHRTLTGLPFDFLTRHAKEGGRL
jgi:hypothetical protein